MPHGAGMNTAQIPDLQAKEVIVMVLSQFTTQQ